MSGTNGSMTPAELEGRGAFVTGGAAGIGFACASALASAGAIVTICGRNEDTLRAAAQKLGGATRWIACDVSDEEQVVAAVAAATEVAGGLHVAVANAGGGGAVGPLVLTELEGWNSTIAVNLTGVFLTIKHTAPRIAQGGGGSVVVISSIAAALTHRYLGPYAVTKAGVEMLVRNAADELGQFGVRVNAIRPGLVPTDATGAFVGDEYTLSDYLAQTPLSRVGTPQDVANAVRFLATDASSWVTGQVFGVDGGHTLRRGPDLFQVIGRHFAKAEKAHMSGERKQ